MNANAGLPRGAKRQRLSSACTQCRKRKVRCDEGQPQCSNCASRGDQCITVHPRNSALEAARRRTSTSVNLAEDWASPPNIASKPYILSNSFVDYSSHDSGSSSATSRIQIAASPSRLSAISSTSPYTTESIPHNIFNQRRGSNVLRNDIPAVSDLYDPEMITNTDSTTRKRKLVGGNTLQSLARYLDHFLDGNGHGYLQHGFMMGMEHAEEGLLLKIGSTPNIPDFPEHSDRTKWLSTFVERIYPLCPIFEISGFKKAMDVFAQQDLKQLSTEDVPMLMSIYSVFALASDEHSATITVSGSTFLDAAYGLYGHVVSMPYRNSVQSLVLLAFALRGRHKEGAAWQVLGQAIRIAQSVGLHHRSKGIISPNENQEKLKSEQLDARIWWTCYCLEMTMGLEVGRPLSIRDSDCDQIIPESSVTNRRKDFLSLWIGLAQIQSQMIEMIYHRSPRAKNAWSLLADIGRIDKLLCEWNNAVEPNEIRPSLDLLCSTQELHLATFLAMNYYQTMITLHQAAFMLDAHAYQAAVNDHCQESPLYARLAGSQKILVNSARKMADLQLDLSDRHLESRLLTASQSMFVMLVLSLNIIRCPNERRIYSDLELLKSSSKYAEDAYKIAGQHPEFIQVIVSLRNRISQKVLSNSAKCSTIHNVLIDTGTIEQQEVVSERTNIDNEGLVHGEAWMEELPQEELWGLDVLEDPWRWLLTEDGRPEI